MRGKSEGSKFSTEYGNLCQHKVGLVLGLFTWYMALGISPKNAESGIPSDLDRWWKGEGGGIEVTNNDKRTSILSAFNWNTLYTIFVLND